MSSAKAAGFSPSSAYLLGLLGVLRARVRRAVEDHRQADPLADDRFRGLYISDREVDTLLGAPTPPLLAAPDGELADERDRIERWADAQEAEGVELRLRALARSFGLDRMDRELLLAALAPDVDPSFERLYAYLHDDVSRRRASTGLALGLCGVALGSAERRRFGPGGALVRAGLVAVEELDRPFLTRPVRVPDRVGGHLLGDDSPESTTVDVRTDPQPLRLPALQIVVTALRSGTRLVYLQESPGGAAAEVAVEALADVGSRWLSVDFARVDPTADPAQLALAITREAGLHGAALVAGAVDCLAGHVPAIRAFTALPCVTVLFGSGNWDTSWSARPPWVVEVPTLAPAERARLWAAALDGRQRDVADEDLVAEVGHLRLSPGDIANAARVAGQRAMAASRPIMGEDLLAGGRSRNAGGLERLARRIEPAAGWDDLVLSSSVVALLRELVARVLRREQVLGRWAMARNSSTGRGVTALFAGESGTGKTLSAEVVALALGLDLYVVDLATVVDKYIGETEKNLDRIFTEADRVNGLLLFDEADALFGKRSEVRDAHDRYANVEVAYLLQRMERFEGLAVLTTNLRANLDEAFTRRLDAVIDFPVPDVEDRLRLWRRHLAEPLPLDDDVDLEFLAGSFRVSGGNIANIALCAAFLAADEDRPVQMSDLIRATEREYRKLGNLRLPSEFGPYHALVAVP